MAEHMAQPKDFGFGSDEQLVRDQARKFLTEHAPIQRTRELVARDHESVYVNGETPGYDREVFDQIVELGWPGLAVPESAGGVDMKLVAVTAIVEEIGRHAFPSPLLSTLHATYVLRAAGGEASAALLEKIAEGTTASLAITGERGSWEPVDAPLVGEMDGQDLVIEGSAHFVQDAAKAEVFVASVRVDEGVALCAVPADAAGLQRRADQIVDLTRDQGRLHFESVRVPADSIVAGPSEGLTALDRAMPALLVLVSADLVGASEWQLQTTTEYAKVRKQFDHTLGFFQAVKHPLVNAMLAIDQARSMLYNAACSFDHEDLAAADLAARMAKSSASDAASFMSSRSVQLHGGIGFTWESDLHLYFKRNKHNQFLFGDGVYQRRKMAEVLIGPMGT